MENNKAELKGVLDFKPYSIPGFWMGAGFPLLSPID